MRNLIIYELEADYANYLQSLGAPSKLVRSYAYRNAVLPQMSGLALALGAVVGGALVTEVVFGYPGVGSLILTAVQNRDYFLLQGAFLFIIIGDPDRELRRRHPLHRRRPAHADRDPGRVRERGRARRRAGRGARRPATRGARRPSASVANGSTSRSGTRKLVIGFTVVVLALAARAARTMADGRRPVRVRLRHRPAAVERTTGWARPPPARTCSRSSSTVCARASSSARSAPRSPPPSAWRSGSSRATREASSTRSSACSRTSCS